MVIADEEPSILKITKSYEAKNSCTTQRWGALLSPHYSDSFAGEEDGKKLQNVCAAYSGLRFLVVTSNFKLPNEPFGLNNEALEEVF